MAKPTLRRADELRLQDFLSSPLWVSAYAFDQDQPWHGEVDEATYRPWDGGLPFTDKGRFAYVLSRAKLTLADGEKLSGFSAPPFEPAGERGRELSTTQPVIFLPDGSGTSFWAARPPPTEQLRRFYSALEKRPEDVFPINYSLDPEYIGKAFSAAIPGFCSPGRNLRDIVVTR